jgi:uncharacterized protein YaiL (DUF2058 family)
MSMSLRDQLLQAGLISKKQAQDADKQQHQHRPKGQHPQHQKKPAGPNPAEEARRAAQKAQAEKLARDQERSRVERDKAERKARQAQVKELVAQNRLPKVQGDDLFNFLDGKDGKNIRRLPVTPEMRQKLVAGQLAIVRSEGRYEVVPKGVMERIRERDERAVIYPAASAPVEAADKPAEDDPYKDYQVPDDLMW